jgi:hypothetical protein
VTINGTKHAELAAGSGLAELRREAAKLGVKESMLRSSHCQPLPSTACLMHQLVMSAILVLAMCKGVCVRQGNGDNAGPAGGQQSVVSQQQPLSDCPCIHPHAPKQAICIAADLH